MMGRASEQFKWRGVSGSFLEYKEHPKRVVVAICRLADLGFGASAIARTVNERFDLGEPIYTTNVWYVVRRNGRTISDYRKAETQESQRLMARTLKAL
jgi:hypothetical protein